MSIINAQTKAETTEQYWQRLVSYYVGAYPALVALIAAHAPSMGVWHSTAWVCGGTCNCRHCTENFTNPRGQIFYGPRPAVL